MSSWTLSILSGLIYTIFLCIVGIVYYMRFPFPKKTTSFLSRGIVCLTALCYVISLLWFLTFPLSLFLWLMNGLLIVAICWFPVLVCYSMSSRRKITERGALSHLTAHSLYLANIACLLFLINCIDLQFPLFYINLSLAFLIVHVIVAIPYVIDL